MAQTLTALEDIQFDMVPYILNRRGTEVSQRCIQICLSVTLSHKDVND